MAVYRKPDAEQNHDIRQAFMEHVGLRLKTLREGLRKSRTVLGAELDMSSYTLQMWESGKRPIPIAALPVLGMALDVRPEYLVSEFCWTDDRVAPAGGKNGHQG